MEENEWEEMVTGRKRNRKYEGGRQNKATGDKQQDLSFCIKDILKLFNIR